LLNYHRSLRKTASFYIKYAILWKTEKWTNPCMHIWIIKEKKKKNEELILCEIQTCPYLFSEKHDV
jgi:hypothetical protein